MMFKVQIVTVLLFICLIDSLHSASYGRMKRSVAMEEDGGGHAVKEEKEDKVSKTEESEGAVENNSNSIPFDYNVILQNLGQIVNKNSDWTKIFSQDFSKYLSGDFMRGFGRGAS